MQDDKYHRIAERVVRRPRMREVSPVVIKTRGPRHPSRLLGSPLILLYSFIALILVGGLLLSLPIASKEPGFTPAIIAFFTSTSAVTVTGLTLVSTADYWSPFGQGVIFTLMLIGGLGFMTLATFLLIVVGQRITLPERMLMRDTMGMDRLGGLVRLTRNIVLVVTGIYLVGILLLFWRFLAYFPAPEALWQAAFHSVSGFNNAGFTILPDSASLSRFALDLPMLIFMIVLIVLGSISWIVLVDLFRHRRFSRLTLDTKLVLTVSLLLWALGAVVMFVTEFSNTGVFGSFSTSGKAFHSLFQSISGRTAGFSTVDFNQVSDLTDLLFTGLMFIGGAAGSTAGGIKVGTFALIIVTVISSIRGRPQAEAFGREIPSVQVHRAMSIAVLGIAVIFILSLVLTFTEEEEFLAMLFDTVSAFATTGLSMGVTERLSTAGSVLFMFAMFLGRLGPLTLVLALAPKEETVLYRFAQERVRIG